MAVSLPVEARNTLGKVNPGIVIRRGPTHKAICAYAWVGGKRSGNFLTILMDAIHEYAWAGGISDFVTSAFSAVTICVCAGVGGTGKYNWR